MAVSETIKSLKIFEKVDRYLLLSPFLKSISKGEFFKNLIIWTLRTGAVFAAVFFLVQWVSAWVDFFSMPEKGVFTPSDVIVFIFFMIISLAAVYATVNTILFKANEIAELPLGTDYIIIPMIGLIYRLIGEIFAVIFLFIGAVGLLISFISKGSFIGYMLSAIPFISAKSDFGTGIAFMVTALFLAITVVVIFYYLAEKNMKKTNY